MWTASQIDVRKITCLARGMTGVGWVNLRIGFWTPPLSIAKPRKIAESRSVSINWSDITWSV